LEEEGDNSPHIIDSDLEGYDPDAEKGIDRFGDIVSIQLLMMCIMVLVDNPKGSMEFLKECREAEEMEKAKERKSEWGMRHDL